MAMPMMPPPMLPTRVPVLTPDDATAEGVDVDEAVELARVPVKVGGASVSNEVASSGVGVVEEEV